MVTSDAQLANELMVKASTISSWRNRGSLDYERVFALCIRRGWSLNYIICGAGDVDFHYEGVINDNNKLISGKDTLQALKENAQQAIYLLEYFTEHYDEVKDIPSIKEQIKSEIEDKNAEVQYRNKSAS